MSTSSDPHTPLKRNGPMVRAPFVDVDTLRNSYDMVAIISQRLSNGQLTFSIFREFARDGETAKTAFIPEDMAEVYLDFAKIVVARMREIRAAGDLPYATKLASTTT